MLRNKIFLLLFFCYQNDSNEKNEMKIKEIMNKFRLILDKINFSLPNKKNISFFIFIF